MNAIDRLAADMDKHGIKRCVRYTAGFCYVELADGRNGTAPTFSEALEKAKVERLAA